MGPKVVSVVNQKGGCGKTTVAMQVAGTLGKRGYRTLVVDADRQGSAAVWYRRAPDERPFPAPVVGLSDQGEKIHRAIEKLIQGYEFVLIDCPGSLDPSSYKLAQSSLLISDLALVPVIPSPLDLEATPDMADLIEKARITNESLDAVVVLNQHDPRRALVREVRTALDGFSIPTAQSALGTREVYRHSADYGATVHDLEGKTGKGVREINRLVDEILDRLGVKAEEKPTSPKGRKKK